MKIGDYNGLIFNEDAINFLKGLPSDSVGAVVMDPPFFVSIGRGKFEGIGHDPWNAGISSMDDIVKWSVPLAQEVNRILRPGGASVVMGGSQSLAGWEVATSRADMRWMAEMTVLWNTGKPRNRNFGSLTTSIRWHIKQGSRHSFNFTGKKSVYSNVMVCTKVPVADRYHTAQKPVELTNFLISLLSEREDVIVDPFCGSGSTLVSAAMCDRRWIGNDLDPDNIDISAMRTQNLEIEASDLRKLYLWVNNKLYPVEG